MSRSDLATAMARMMNPNANADNEPHRSKLAPDIEAIRLLDALAIFNTTHRFAPGMIVRQKPLARQYVSFGDNDLAIVVEILPEPIIDGADSTSSSSYRQRMDMIIGSIEQGREGDVFALFHVDSRRFEPVSSAELALVTKPVANDLPNPDRAGPPTPRRTPAEAAA